MDFTVHPQALNRQIATVLKERKLIAPPAWVPFAKTGTHKERIPHDPDWFYHRAASVLRTVATRGPIGTSKLSVLYGGRKNRGVKPDKFTRASTNVLRKCLQQLEKSGLIHQVERSGHKGRALTKKGTELIKESITKVQA